MLVVKPKPIWLLMGCPKCKAGDMFRDDHRYECLQCGYTKWDDKPLIRIGKGNTNITAGISKNRNREGE